MQKVCVKSSLAILSGSVFHVKKFTRMVLRSTPVRAEQKSTGLLAPFSLYKYVAVWVPKIQAPHTDALITHAP